jgi:hypothetical protein
MSEFWQWFLTRRWDAPGISKFWDRWLIMHLAVGLILARVVPVPLVEAAKTVLLPLASVLVGLSFAWAGNAQALLQTREIEKFAEKHAAGIRNYVFTFLVAILSILVTVVFWSLAALGIFDKQWPTSVHPKSYFVVATMLYGAASITLRECWHVVIGAQLLLLTRKDVKDAKARNDTKSDDFAKLNR